MGLFRLSKAKMFHGDAPNEVERYYGAFNFSIQYICISSIIRCVHMNNRFAISGRYEKTPYPSARVGEPWLQVDRQLTEV